MERPSFSFLFRQLLGDRDQLRKRASFRLEVVAVWERQ